MYKTTIFSKEKEIISSGSVVSFSNNPLKFTLFEDDKQIVSFEFIFKSNPDVKGPKFSTTVENNILHCVLTNFDNPHGAGSVKPIYFAKYNNRELYLHFRVFALSESDRSLHYAVYIEEDKSKVMSDKSAAVPGP